jgi:predicted nucleic acid-binding protein
MNRVAVWWGAPVEIRSALNRLAREETISPKDHAQAVARLRVLRATWREVMPGEKVREIAEDVLERHALRALDSFQLAAALVWCLEKPQGRLFVCADRRLNEAAERAGFTILP